MESDLGNAFNVFSLEVSQKAKWHDHKILLSDYSSVSSDVVLCWLPHLTMQKYLLYKDGILALLKSVKLLCISEEPGFQFIYFCNADYTVFLLY